MAKSKRKAWSQKEDQIIIDSVKDVQKEGGGLNRAMKLAQKRLGSRRTIAAARTRWLSHIKPKLASAGEEVSLGATYRDWSATEDQAILEAVLNTISCGGSIAKGLEVAKVRLKDGRTEAAIRTRWQSEVKPLFEKELGAPVSHVTYGSVSKPNIQLALDKTKAVMRGKANQTSVESVATETPSEQVNQTVVENTVTIIESTGSGAPSKQQPSEPQPDKQSDISLDDIVRLIERYAGQNEQKEQDRTKHLEARIETLEQQLNEAYAMMKPALNAARELLKIDDVRDLIEYQEECEASIWRIDQNGIAERVEISK